MKKTLQEALKERKEKQDKGELKPFVPGEVYHNKLGNFIEVYLKDVRSYSEQVDKRLTIMKDIDSDEIIGYKIYGDRIT